jgi:hypothetical protein
MRQEVEKLRAEGYPLRIIGNGGYPATLYGIQPLNDGEYMASTWRFTAIRAGNVATI